MKWGFRLVGVGVIVWAIAFLGRQPLGELENGARGESASGNGLEAMRSDEKEREFSLGLHRLHRKSPPILVEASEVPYFLRRVAIRLEGDMLFQDEHARVDRLEDDPSSSGTVQGVDGSVMEVLVQPDPAAWSSRGTVKLEYREARISFSVPTRPWRVESAPRRYATG